MQDNVAKQWQYSTILAADTFSNTGEFAKMVYPDFFLVKVVIGIRPPRHPNFHNFHNFLRFLPKVLICHNFLQECPNFHNFT